MRMVSLISGMLSALIVMLIDESLCPDRKVTDPLNGPRSLGVTSWLFRPVGRKLQNTTACPSVPSRCKGRVICGEKGCLNKSISIKMVTVIYRYYVRLTYVASELMVCHTRVMLSSSGSFTITVWLLMKPISPFAMSEVTVKVMFRAPANLGLMGGIGGLILTRSTLSS